jgi:hypothetical protein
MDLSEKIIPEQKTGIAIETSADVVAKTNHEAVELFKMAVSRLQQINEWDKIANGISATFTIVNEKGEKLMRSPEKGDYFKIDIPGPGTKSGYGFDWVRLEEIIETDNGDTESYGFRVRPSGNPSENSTETAHFYSPESTSTFLITRNYNAVSAKVFDRNTKPNQEAKPTVDKIRDAVVGVAGLVGLSKLQWKSLVEGLVAHNKNSRS